MMVRTCKPRKSKKEHVWTETERQNLALVLADEKKQYAVRLETFALKKSSNNQVFEQISSNFEKLLLYEELKEQNEREKSKSKGNQKNSPLDISPARLRIKYKFLRDEPQDTCMHTDSSSHSPSRIYTRRMIRLQYKSGQWWFH